MTSGPSKAIKAAILGRKYQISFSGKTSFNFIEDIAEVFVESSMSTKVDGALALNIKGTVLSVNDFLEILHKEIPQSKNLISIKKGATTLPLAFDFDQQGLDKLLPNQKYTTIQDGIKKTAQAFAQLQKEGLLHDRDLLD